MEECSLVKRRKRVSPRAAPQAKKESSWRGLSDNVTSRQQELEGQTQEHGSGGGYLNQGRTTQLPFIFYRGMELQVEKNVMKMVLAAYPVNSTVSGDLAGTVEKKCGVERSLSGVEVGEPFQHVGQSCDCSQVETELEVRDMDWQW